MTGGDNSCRNRGGPGIIPVQQAVTVIDKKYTFVQESSRSNNHLAAMTVVKTAMA